MAEVNSSILIDWAVGLDFCKTHDQDCDVTRRALRELNDFGVNIYIRRQCWERVTKTLASVQVLLEYLRDSASELLGSCSTDEALNQYKSNTLELSTLRDDLGLDPAQIPDIDELRADVEDMGLNSFREYTHNHLSLSVKAQRELNLLTTEKENKSGFDPHFFEAAIGELMSKDGQVELLVDAYGWAGTKRDYLLTREGSEIYNKKPDIEDKMNGSNYRILSPEDIMEVANQ